MKLSFCVKPWIWGIIWINVDVSIKRYHFQEPLFKKFLLNFGLLSKMKDLNSYVETHYYCLSEQLCFILWANKKVKVGDENMAFAKFVISQYSQQSDKFVNNFIAAKNLHSNFNLIFQSKEKLMKVLKKKKMRS
jgi:hypothetical protein